MRPLLATALLLAALCPIHAQEQEGKLVTRLLRPDTSLGNPAQSKKFTADRVAVDRKAPVGTFYLQRKSLGRNYAKTHDFDAGSYQTAKFDSSGSGNSLMAARSSVRTPKFETPAARVSVDLRDSNKQAATARFAGNRPFLEKGKSQKSLDRKTTPMTIEQVRELLNKNK